MLQHAGKVWNNKRILVVVLLACVWGWTTPIATVHSQTGQPPLPTDSGVQVLSSMLPTGVQQIVVVESKGQSMAVYHVEPVHGKIQLKSVRRLTWDLQMEQFNGLDPLPSELKALR